jgi:hypothetical protein
MWLRMERNWRRSRARSWVWAAVRVDARLVVEGRGCSGEAVVEWLGVRG